MTEYHNMPEPDGLITFDGVDYPCWIVKHNDGAVKVSTTELQDKLLVDGDIDGDYVNEEAQAIDESVAFYVDKEDSVDTVKDACWVEKPQKTGDQLWSAIGNCVYNGDDLGSLVAECASRAIAVVLAEHANSNPELRKKVRDAM